MVKPSRRGNARVFQAGSILWCLGETSTRVPPRREDKGGVVGHSQIPDATLREMDFPHQCLLSTLESTSPEHNDSIEDSLDVNALISGHNRGRKVVWYCARRSKTFSAEHEATT